MLFVRKIWRTFTSPNSAKNIPVYYRKLLHPVHVIEKMILPNYNANITFDALKIKPNIVVMPYWVCVEFWCIRHYLCWHISLILSTNLHCWLPKIYGCRICDQSLIRNETRCIVVLLTAATLQSIDLVLDVPEVLKCVILPYKYYSSHVRVYSYS